MPSHTFTRVGLWKESIETNRRSAEAARKENATSEELHAMDYQAYAYLQIAQDAAARRVADEAIAAAARLDVNANGVAAPGVAGVYAAAAIPARYALERNAWAEAASLTAHEHKVSAHRCHQPFRTRARCRPIRESRRRRRRYRTACRAPRHAEDDAGRVLGRAGGNPAPDRDRVGRHLRKATSRVVSSSCARRPLIEDGTDKSAVSPGPLAPARELLGYMLLEAGRPADALVEFEATTKKEPNRFHGFIRSGARRRGSRPARTSRDVLQTAAPGRQ